MSPGSKGKHPGGRPRKFAEPSRPVTVTLPERTLEQLQSIGPDRARSIVKAVDRLAGRSAGGRKPRTVELVEMEPGLSVLVVPPSQGLRKLPWLRMIEVAPGRNLLTILPGTPIEKVEVGLLDLIEAAPGRSPEEKALLEALRERIGDLRRHERISKAEILVVAHDGAAMP